MDSRRDPVVARPVGDDTGRVEVGCVPAASRRTRPSSASTSRAGQRASSRAEIGDCEETGVTILTWAARNSAWNRPSARREHRLDRIDRLERLPVDEDQLLLEPDRRQPFAQEAALVGRDQSLDALGRQSSGAPADDGSQPGPTSHSANCAARGRQGVAIG